MRTRSPKLLDQVRNIMRREHYSIRTEASYLNWIKRFTLRVFHQKRHSQELGRPEIETFLTDLAVNQHVTASTQNQALHALLFLYRRVLHQDITGIKAVRAKQPQRLPTVMTRPEVSTLLAALRGTHQLIAKLLYGSGLRVMECLRLRVKDLDKDVKTTMIYTHVLNRGGLGVRSPLETL